MAMPAGLPPMAISATDFISLSDTTLSESPVWLVTKASLTVLADSDAPETATAMLPSIAAVNDTISRVTGRGMSCLRASAAGFDFLFQRIEAAAIDALHGLHGRFIRELRRRVVVHEATIERALPLHSRLVAFALHAQRGGVVIDRQHLGIDLSNLVFVELLGGIVLNELLFD